MTPDERRLPNLMSAAHDPRGQLRFHLDPASCAAVLVEGFGGHTSGGIGAELVRDLFARSLSGRAWEQLSPPQAISAARRTIEQAGDLLRRAWDLDVFYHSMGTSFAALWLLDGAWVMASLGDVGIYRIAGGRAEALTVAHVCSSEGTASPGLLTHALPWSAKDAVVASQPSSPDEIVVLLTGSAVVALGQGELLRILSLLRHHPTNIAGELAGAIHARRPDLAVGCVGAWFA